MMRVTVSKSDIHGTVKVSASKSVAHRALICAALAIAESCIKGRLEGDDIKRTIAALNKLGARILKISDDCYHVTPISISPVTSKDNTDMIPELDMGSSGSSLRFLLTVAAALGVPARFVGNPDLQKRPVTDLIKELRRHGLTVSSDTLPFEIKGRLTPGEYLTDCSVSSQYATGFLLALPILDGDSVLKILGKKASKDYITVTLNVQSDFGINIKNNGDEYFISAAHSYESCDEYYVEGDYSSAAAIFSLGAVAGDVGVEGLDPKSKQSDKVVLELLGKLGAEVRITDKTVFVKKDKIRAIDFDAKDCPDLVPVLAAVLASACGTSRIYSCDRLKVKESDRLIETIKLLNQFGIEAETDGKVLTIHGGSPQGGKSYVCPNDHRMAMAATVLASVSDKPTCIINAECVAKSYPDFFVDFKLLNGQME